MVRMRNAAFFQVSARDPWVVEQLPAERVLPMLPPASHLISYHIVVEGSCFATSVSGEIVKLDRGQVIVFTKGDAHVLSSQPGLRVNPSTTCSFDPIAAGAPLVARMAEDGPVSATLICGFLGCDSLPFNPLLDNLPPVLIGQCSENDGLPSLGELIRLAVNEAANERAGGQTVLGRLTELMFIEVVRQHLDRLPPENWAWLAGLRDSFVGRALSLMHGDPARSWSLEELAREIGLCRSEFAERFTAFVGLPPMQYLARWRMDVATALLRDQVNMASIAAAVGYGSEAAFSRAFKKIVGVPPSEWRQRGDLLEA